MGLCPDCRKKASSSEVYRRELGQPRPSGERICDRCGRLY